MKELVKWTYWTFILLLVVALIDLNVNPGKTANGETFTLERTNLTLGGTLVLLVFIGWTLKKLKK